jgi:hypothetical protein
MPAAGDAVLDLDPQLRGEIVDRLLGVIAYREAQGVARLLAEPTEAERRLLAMCHQSEGLFYEVCLEETGAVFYDAVERTWKDVAQAYGKALGTLGVAIEPIRNSVSKDGKSRQDYWREVSALYRKELQDRKVWKELPFEKPPKWVPQESRRNYDAIGESE